MADVYAKFRDFYPFYLEQHRNQTCRRLHFIGICLMLLVALAVVITGGWSGLWLLPLLGYGFAWVGHFFFEKNRPATFKYPVYSLMGDWVMFRDILIGRIHF